MRQLIWIDRRALQPFEDGLRRTFAPTQKRQRQAEPKKKSEQHPGGASQKVTGPAGGHKSRGSASPECAAF